MKVEEVDGKTMVGEWEGGKIGRVYVGVKS